MGFRLVGFSAIHKNIQLRLHLWLCRCDILRRLAHAVPDGIQSCPTLRTTVHGTVGVEVAPEFDRRCGRGNCPPSGLARLIHETCQHLFGEGSRLR